MEPQDDFWKQIAVITLTAVIVGFYTYLQVRGWRRKRNRVCKQCGNSLYQRDFVKEVADGMPATFCDRECYMAYRGEKG